MLMSSVAVREGDDHLAALLRTRSSDAFAQVYDQYAGALYGYICRAVSGSEQAEALLQDVFLRMWREIDGYDPSKERLFTWLFKLAVNACGESADPVKSLYQNL
jgi:RNA polymerase sigma-70 factor (ECF subfamily)